MARKLGLYDDYTRDEVHDVFDPDSTFTPQAGSWGLWGIVEIPERPRDYVFLVTFGQKQAGHEFDEGISAEGVLRWQSQPRQRLKDRTIQNLIAHDEDVNSVYLFLRTAEKRSGSIVPYTYLGRLKYLAHDKDREQPVYFTWQILEWPMPDSVRLRIQLKYEQATGDTREPSKTPSRGRGLIYVAPPRREAKRSGLSSQRYSNVAQPDFAAQDAQNRRLGFAGEEAVISSETALLAKAGRPDLAERVVHVSKIEGDHAGYDIRSFTTDGDVKFIEVKTTRGNAATAFYLSANEVAFAATHSEDYYLYRVFEFDEGTASGSVYVQRGSISDMYSLIPIVFKAHLADPKGK